MAFNQRFRKFTFNFHSSEGEVGGQLSRQSHSKLEPTEVSRWEEWREFVRPERRGRRGTALSVVSQFCLFLAGVLGVITYSRWASVFSSADGTGTISQALCLTCCAYQRNSGEKRVKSGSVTTSADLGNTLHLSVPQFAHFVNESVDIWPLMVFPGPVEKRGRWGGAVRTANCQLFQASSSPKVSI